MGVAVRWLDACYFLFLHIPERGVKNERDPDSMLHREESLAIVSWNKGQFRIARQPVSAVMFDQWLQGEGRSVLRETLRNTPVRWFFGNARAQRALRRNVRRAFRPRGTFCTATVKHLNRLPLLIRSGAVKIQKAGHRELCTFDTTAAIVVVPRGVVRSDVKSALVKELTAMSQIRAFNGLAERVLSSVAVEAETVFFNYVVKGGQLVDETGRGVVLGADADFRWNIGGTNGHYYYAASLEEGVDLSGSRERRRFLSDIRELFHGQAVHLKRLRPDEAHEMAETFRLLQRFDGRRADSPAERARRIRATVDMTL